MLVKIYPSNSSMTNSLLMVVVIFMTAVFGFHIGTTFAMHDSTLDVNTWIASDNSTQLHTIDLNKGPVSPTTATGASTPEETTGESTEGGLSAADENGDETTSSDGDEENDDGNTIFEDENGDDGNSEGED
jgi:hypothetical protein